MSRHDAPDLAVQLMASYQGAAILTSTLGQPEIVARQARRLQEWIETLDGNDSNRP
jgi:TetR/AcrR family transcriptional repressor of nem operon